MLTLFARSRILREDGKLDGEKCARMTSNQFLNCVGEPTKVEAALGRLYQQQGLEKAFAWIEKTLMPIFERQEQNRLKKLPLKRAAGKNAKGAH